MRDVSPEGHALGATGRESGGRVRLGVGSIIVGVILVILAILPFIRAATNGPLVLSDYEVFAVTGVIFIDLGLLVLLQEWFGLV